MEDNIDLANNSNPYLNFGLPIIHNSHSLNIFSDASMRPNPGTTYNFASCYGAVAVCKDDIIEEMYKINTDTTVPAAELRGIALSLDLAYKYRYTYPVINIFSDSKLSILGIRDYSNSWAYNYNTNLYYNKSNPKVPVKNQEIIIGILRIINDLRSTNVINLYHQKGHVDNLKSALLDAIDCFKKSNYIPGKVDYQVIRYISTYNNYVDNKSRSIIRRTNIYKNKYRDPVTFHAMGNPKLIYKDQVSVPPQVFDYSDENIEEENDL